LIAFPVHIFLEWIYVYVSIVSDPYEVRILGLELSSYLMISIRSKARPQVGDSTPLYEIACYLKSCLSVPIPTLTDDARNGEGVEGLDGGSTE